MPCSIERAPARPRIDTGEVRRNTSAEAARGHLHTGDAVPPPARDSARQQACFMVSTVILRLMMSNKPMMKCT